MWKKGRSVNTIRSLGIEHYLKSYAVESALVDFGSEHSFEEAAKIFKRHYKFEISDSTIRRMTESLGAEAEAFISKKIESFAEAYENETSTISPIEVVILGFDGCSIRTGKLEKIENIQPDDKKRFKRIEEWKDIRLGFSRELAEESKKWFVGGLKSYPELMEELFKLSLGQGMNEYTKPVAIADGGISIYEEASNQFHDLQFILDYYHFGEHLYEAAEAMSLNKDSKKNWVDCMKNLAFEGKIDELKQSLEADYEKTEVDRLRRLIGYVERFKDSLNYGEYRDKGYPIGSGEVESSHRYITQKRLKIAGACWLKENINPMLALRILKANDWWDEFWMERDEFLVA
jgi:hypothetical protein